MSEWRVDNNGTGETVSIYDGDRVVADVYDDVDALAIVRASARLAVLERALRDLIPFTEECIDAGYRDADIPIMMQWPPLNRARAAEAGDATCGMCDAHAPIWDQPVRVGAVTPPPTRRY